MAALKALQVPMCKVKEDPALQPGAGRQICFLIGLIR
jgi:hypothetical protein